MEQSVVIKITTAIWDKTKVRFYNFVWPRHKCPIFHTILNSILRWGVFKVLEYILQERWRWNLLPFFSLRCWSLSYYTNARPRPTTGEGDAATEDMADDMATEDMADDMAVAMGTDMVGEAADITVVDIDMAVALEVALELRSALL